MKNLTIIALFFLLKLSSYTQSWYVKDVGIGILDMSEYTKELKIVQRSNYWSKNDIYNFKLLTDTEKTFATWIVGPPIKDFLNNKGQPALLCEYVITYPDKSKEKFGPFGFFEPGFSILIINPSTKLIGKWKIDYYIIDRDTGERRHAATRYFTLSE
ncbi:MAG: hypothetical protein ABFC18_00890 [Rikenellaceae bacterium]|jgi:hypothetical protein